MKYLNLSLVDEPVEVEDFKMLTESDYPFVCAAVQIKNRFDQDRINFNKKYQADNIFHVIYDKGNVTCMCLKALPIKIKPDYKVLIKQLQINADPNPKVYKNLLAEFDLSCDNCFAYLKSNTYPIDGKHLQKISATKLKEEDLYSKVLNTKSVPFYQAFSYFSLFILSHNPFITDKMKKDFCSISGVSNLE
tara:strand:+ start:5502 stop:6074 length:573 start_codon:yes stop_codon:yes gene_type:complete